MLCHHYDKITNYTSMPKSLDMLLDEFIEFI